MTTRQDYLNNGYTEVVDGVAFLWPGNPIGKDYFCDVFRYCWSKIPDESRLEIIQYLKQEGDGTIVLKVHRLPGEFMGYCVYYGSEIRINDVAVMLYPQSKLRNVVWHELAHIADYARNFEAKEIIERVIMHRDAEDWVDGEAYKGFEDRADRIMKEWGVHRTKFPRTKADEKRMATFMPAIEADMKKLAELRRRARLIDTMHKQ